MLASHHRLLLLLSAHSSSPSCLIIALTSGLVFILLIVVTEERVRGSNISAHRIQKLRLNSTRPRSASSGLTSKTSRPLCRTKPTAYVLSRKVSASVPRGSGSVLTVILSIEAEGARRGGGRVTGAGTGSIVSTHAVG